MQCPNCGSLVTDAQATICPTCGQALPRAFAPSGEAPVVGRPLGTSAPFAAQDAPPSSAPGTWQGYATPPVNMPPSYGQPVPPAYAPDSAAFGAPPGYGQAGQPSAYPAYPTYPSALPGYGQPGPPSYVPYPPYAPSSPYMPPPLSSVPPPRRRSAARVVLLVVSIVAAAIVVLGGALGLLYYVGTHSRAQTPAGGNPFATASTTASGQRGTVIFQDSLTDPTTNWANDPGNCFYGAGGYHVGSDYLCYAPAGDQTDFDMSVQVMQVQGPATNPYGVTFRATRHVSRFDFFITSNSEWEVVKCVTDGLTCTKAIDFTSNPAIKGGLNTSNTLDVKAVGGHFDFLVNGTKVGQLDDGSLQSGLVGLAAGDNVESVYTNFIVSRPA